MLQLVLVRHGEAERQAAADHLRRLTPHGREEAMATGRLLAGLSLVAPAVFSSPYLRARETGELLARALGVSLAGELPGVTPDDPVRLALKALDAVARPGRTLVVATHMPLIAGLIGVLVHDDPRALPGVRTGGGAVLAGEVVVPGQMRLVRTLDP